MRTVKEVRRDRKFSWRFSEPAYYYGCPWAHCTEYEVAQDLLSDVNNRAAAAFDSASDYLRSPSAIDPTESLRFVGYLNETIEYTKQVKSALEERATGLLHLLFPRQFGSIQHDSEQNDYWRLTRLAGEYSDSESGGGWETWGAQQDSILAGDAHSAPELWNWSPVSNIFLTQLGEYVDFYGQIIDRVERTADTLARLRHYILPFIHSALFGLGRHRSKKTDCIEGFIPYLTWPRPPTLNSDN